MRPRTVLALFVVAAGLAAFIWFFERDLPSTDERAELAKKLLGVEPGEITGVALSAGEGRVALVRDEDGDWMLREPINARADSDKVLDLVGRLSDLENLRSLEGVTAEELGLEEPRAVVEITTPERRLILSVGPEVPASGNTVAALGEGPPFYVVPDVLQEDVDREPRDWRSRDVVPVEQAEITGIDLARDGALVSLVRGESGFELTQPIVDEADPDRVEELLSELVELEAEDFLDSSSDRSAAGSGQGEMGSVALSVAGATEPITLRLGSADSSGERHAIWAADDGYAVVSKLPELVALPASDWRSSRWTTAKVFEIEGFEIERDGRTLALARENGEWTADGEAVEYSLASDLLHAATGARGVPSPDLDLAAADLVAEIVLSFADTGERLRLFEGREGYLAEREGRGVVLVLGSSSADSVVEKLEELWARPEPDEAES